MSREKTAAAARLDEAYTAWDTALKVIDQTRTKQMAAPGLQEPAKKALATLEREWDGLAAHRDYPMISLDNNAAERMIRGPVVTRKNAGGSRNEDSARLAATIWTVTATAQMAGLNVLTWLTAYLDRMRPQRRETPHRASAGTVPALDRQPRRPPRLGDTTPAARLTPRGNHRRRHANRPRRLLAMPAHMTSEYVLVTPIKKIEGVELLDWQKAFNTAINQTRAVVERVIANLKTWRILHTDYRRPLGTFDTTISAVIGLQFYSLV